MKIAFLSGKQTDGTLLPVKERYVWKEVCRILDDELSLPLFNQATFLIPIFNKFDLYALRHAEKNGCPVEYFVPSLDWGTKGLPKHQTLLISRMNYHRHIYPDNQLRAKEMIRQADMVYILPETIGLEQFKEDLKGKLVCRFPVERMRFKTEEEAEIYYNQLKKETTVYMNTTEVEQLVDKKMEEEALNDQGPLLKDFPPAGGSNFFDFLNNNPIDDSGLPF